MTESQRLAADPALSVWVAASAGSGKTKVLTDRVLRLLLDGVRPHRVLCLTYTNAAAKEMRHRLQKTLSQWAIQSEERCAAFLTDLTGQPPKPALLARARTLFATVLESEEGVRIQTLHAFCQSLLRRFPIEAGVAANLQLLDERGRAALLKEARQRLFSNHGLDDPRLVDALKRMAAQIGLSKLEELLEHMSAQQRRFGLMLERKQLGPLQAALREWLGVEEHAEAPAQFEYDDDQRGQLLAVARALLASDKPTSQTRGEALATWLAEGTPAAFVTYRRQLLTAAGTPAARLLTADVEKAMPQAREILLAEQARMVAQQSAEIALRTERQSEALLTLFVGMMQFYGELKRQRAVLDYDDLILHTVALLERPGISAWVLYKLDGGMDHVLLDEAQDTSREQWRIVQLLTEDAFAGESANPRARSLFVVGDEKQSIYSFQGAAPEEFDRMRAYFKQKSDAAQHPFERVRLATSFRSTQAVLTAVDAVFALPEAKAGLDLSEKDIAHEAYRQGVAGLVEFWPKVELAEETEDAPTFRRRPERLQAQLVGHAIERWLADRRRLPSQNRAVEPGDIMVLVRKRGRFVDALVGELKRRGVPVAGADRIELNEQLAVKDVLVLCDVLLLPEDDLALATALRGPLFNASEEMLYDLAHGRGDDTLITRLRRAALDEAHAHHQAARAIVAELSVWMDRTDYLTPYALLAEILYRADGMRRLQKRLGPQALDPLEELMQQALIYQQEECAHLQGFLHWLRSGEIESKREAEQGRNEVRIFTVHGAKGLQAPIVILADTLDMQSRTDELLWGEHGGLPVALWPRKNGSLHEGMANTIQARAESERRERNRQLYVAMTRAEDELYIAGWQPRGRKEDPHSWYALARQGLQSVPGIEAFDFAADYAVPAPLAASLAEGGGLRLRGAQTAEIAPRPAVPAAVAIAPLPDFLSRPAPIEPVRLRILAPSHQNETGGVFSPITQAAALRRGTLVHGLLQWLPEVAPEHRAMRAAQWLDRRATDLDEAARAAIGDSVLALMERPECAHLFAPGSLAEVPLSGILATPGAPRTVNGQIDRLVVGAEEILLVDYKTSQRVPASPQATPLGYLRQMSAYRDLLRRIYPHHRIRALLVWTAGPSVMELPDALLDAQSLETLSGAA